ncbi:MAG: helix-turn-helix domain-containing protein, partial [Bacteroidota bacterium]
MENITFESLPAAVSKLLEKVSNIEMQLQKSSGQQPITDTWFDLSELYQYLPDKPAKPTVYAYVQRRTIPFHKKGKKLFFLKSEIDLYLKSGRRTT